MTTSDGPGSTRDFDVVLVLSGGNALGAFEAGVYQALHEHDLQPDWVVGASIGAINGALIAGTMPERRLDTLRAFWRPNGFGMGEPGTPWLPSAIDIGRRTSSVAWTVFAGRTGIFGPLLSSLNPWASDKPSLFETEQLSATLTQLVDFDQLNTGPCRYTATAVDLASGEDVVFDSRDRTIDARHIRASAALPVVFPPIEVDGRWLVDGGVSANLPLDPVMEHGSSRPVLCIAVDLLPLVQALPKTLGETAGRLQNLIFAAQSRRTIARWQAAYDGNDRIHMTLVRLAYGDQRHEVSGKALDFSGPTIERRWAAGQAAAMTTIGRLAAGSLPIGKPGFHIVDPD